MARVLPRRIIYCLLISCAIFIITMTTLQQVEFTRKMLFMSQAKYACLEVFTVESNEGQQHQRKFNTFDNLRNMIKRNIERRISIHQMTDDDPRRRMWARSHQNEDLGTVQDLPQHVNEPAASSFSKFEYHIGRYELYPENDPNVDQLLSDLHQQPIVSISQGDEGSQLTLIIHLANGGQALVKPMRFPREQGTFPNHFYFTDYERHFAEIAAFHLDRILGFRRAVPVVGRVLNIPNEIFRLSTGERLRRTFFTSPDGNYCFHGECDYYCDTSHAFCGSPDTIEASFAIFLPDAVREDWQHPYQRSYTKMSKAEWEVNPEYCNDLKEQPEYKKGRRLLDLVDMSILDFLMGNMDRHHYETFEAFGNDSTPFHFDHGRGFGSHSHDELSILAPLSQCCLVRQSTVDRLLTFQNASSTTQLTLSAVMERSLLRDPLRPILLKPHLQALDRRLDRILQTVVDCVDGQLQRPATHFYDVLIDDYF